MTPVMNYEHTRPMLVADPRKWDSETSNIATPSRHPGWPAQFDHWSEGETQKTNSQSPPVGDKTLSKIWTRIGDPCRKPHLPGGHERERRD